MLGLSGIESDDRFNARYQSVSAAVFGGIGSVPGALIGGILLGIIEIFAKAYISTQLSDAIVFCRFDYCFVGETDGFIGQED